MNSPELNEGAVQRLGKERRSDTKQDHHHQSNGSIPPPLSSTGGDTAIEITDRSFKWSTEDEKPCLDSISLSVKKGSLVAVVGQVGAGKSSLLAAMLGEMGNCSLCNASRGTSAKL